MNNIVITTGDPGGIGQEVTFKAIRKIGPVKNNIFIVFINNRSRQLKNYTFDKFDIIIYKSLHDYLYSKLNFTFKNLIIIKSPLPPAEWVVQSTLAGINQKISALVTGPLSKTESYKTHQLKGHTDIFREYIKTPIFMSFIGKYFNVLLLTDHIPLKNVPKKLNQTLLINAFKQSLGIANLFPKRKIAVIGLNPHSGENNLIGNEESQIFKPVIKSFNKSSNIKLTQPLVPDVAFLKKNWSEYSLFISPYHDQGLTAFKMIHEQNNGIQLTLGLPFIRTSVDHGTAKDIFGKNIADERSMIMAIKYSLKLIKTQYS